MKTILLGCMLALATMQARAAEPVSLIVTPLANSSELKALTRRPGVAAEPLFDRGERAALVRMHEAALAASLKLTVATREDAAALRDWAARARLKVRIDENPVVTTTGAAGGLGALQWALDNRGLAQKLAIDDLTTIDVPGRPGEDAGVRKAPAENADAAKKIIVAVLDTGVDYAHPDLQGQLVRKTAECEALATYTECLKKKDKPACDATIDTDGNGYPLDCSGWNITSGKNKVTGLYGDPNAADDAGHGTHVAGIIAGASHGSGLNGVARNVQILPVKVIKTSPNQPIRPQSADPSDALTLPSPLENSLRWSPSFGDLIARGLLYAIRNGAQVINMSLAWPAAVDSLVLRKMVALAHERGILIVAAAGNDSADARVFPCGYDGVICVAAHGPDGSLSHFSNYGSFVDLAAPGLDILSSWPLGKRTVNFTEFDGYETKNGTSMASPFVAGAAARLLNAGLSPREAYARLVTGARPQQPAEYAGAPRMPKYTRSGNLDLAASFAAPVQPLILEASKRPIALLWNQSAAAPLPFKVSLKNFWGAAAAVHVRARILSKDGSLTVSTWEAGAWAADESKDFESALSILRADIDGRQTLELEIESEQSRALGRTAQLVRVPLELAVPVTATTAFAGVESLPIEGGQGLSNEAELRSVTALDGQPGQDYLALTERGPQTLLQLLIEKNGSYSLAASSAAPTPAGDLVLVQRVDVFQNGAPTYVLIYRLQPANGARNPSFRFQYFSSGLSPLATVDYDNSTAVMGERFRWMRTAVDGHPRLVPAWIAMGTTPEAEKAKFDPWNPKPKDVPKHRLYYLLPSGVRSVPTADGFFFIQLLATGTERPGVLQAVLAKGDDYKLTYQLSEVENGSCGKIFPLALPRFRMLVEADQALETTPLDPRALSVTTAFTNRGAGGTMRTTVFPGTVDFRQTPPGVTDAVSQLSGVFLGAKTRAAFAQTHYELQFDDFVTGQSARTGLDRFSFLPAFIFGRTFFPVAVASNGADRIPGLLIPATLGVSDAAEVVVPDYDSNGRLLGLRRPALYRFLASEGCEALGNPLVADADSPTRLAFHCGDRIIRVPLRQSY